MTKKIAISLPDHIADRVAQEENASAYISGLVSKSIDRDRTFAALRSLGFALTDDEMAEARATLTAVRATVTPELRAKAAAIRAEGMRRR